MSISNKMINFVGATSIALSLSFSVQAADMPMPFGGKDSTKYASDLWMVMEKSSLVGPNAIMSTPYEGQEPHGAFLDTIDTKVTVNGHSGFLIIKRNYGGEGVSKEDVAEKPNKFLGAVTVMFKREKGYDTENKDWFYVKYDPKGGIMKNPKGAALAGRVAKGMDQGCIACHMAAPGGDYVFNFDRTR
ncbi:MAG: cytochrome P460 family protein [Alphaproteobacteria bacterium]|nr:cytochrome P460 family protein [Rhodospirillales bacterium]MCW9044727.1 cytochrome P460 family protein [Alphaproteobacteria bacterium]